MKQWLIFSAAGLMAAALPALALAQTTPQTQPRQQTRSQQTMPQQMQPRTMPQQQKMPMHQHQMMGKSSVHKEVAMAHTHALMAQGAKTVKKAHTHLQHVVNCLVGPHGNGFDPTAENPCAGMGQGALPDSKNNQALHMRLQRALNKVQQGQQAQNLSRIHKDASQAARMLQSGHGNMGTSNDGY